MKYQDRWYQTEAADALWNAIQEPGCAPVIAVPTGAGKTVIMGLFVKKYLEENPHDEVLILTHTKHIIEQDAAALESFFPNDPIGVYSSGLGRKEHEQITVGGIQSVIKNPKLFQWANLVIVDEVHKVNAKSEGTYRKLLDNMHATLTGMSATVFRTGHGFIHKGKHRLFNTLAYDLSSVENYNRLVTEGYLAKLIAVEPKLKLDSSKVSSTASDYNIKELAKTHDQDVITQAAIKEAIYYGKNYKKWLVFAIDIKHADHICAVLNDNHISAESLHSRMDGDEASILKRFTNGRLRAIVSVDKITTGFDSPNVDLILMLRPTMSAILHVQMAGRGARPYEGKKHCLYLDYAGNTTRLGPINNVIIPKEARTGDGEGEAPTKTCPKCRTIMYAQAKTCESCGHEFIFESKLELSASTEDIVENGVYPTSKEKWLNVQRVQYNIHTKVGSPSSLLVTYHCGLTKVKEWICVDHPGFAGKKAQHMLRYRGYTGPMTTHAAFLRKNELRTPKRILVDFSGKYQTITNAQF